MKTNNIKPYAPKARAAFIAAMSKRAALFGIRESSIPSMGIEPLQQKGDLALIGDRAFPANIIRPRAALVKKVEQMGFTQAMEQAAYSWFNRLCAIRYMELKGYLEHGRRVLSAADGSSGVPQILDDCLDIELEGLDRRRIAELKLDGTKDEELYRELLLAQCHALHQAMPFLFEAVDDAAELLLPDNLTKTDSLIRELVDAIPEEDWQDVEIIGWLYQFYISEKKDQVIGKVVKSEDIPAATQLFTPNWIVQYLVQNSVGRQWLQTYPDSPLKEKMPYYIEPAEQTPEVQAQLAAITPDSIDPLTIKVLDPACGSGHILVEAYKVLKAIYEERGHRSRDIPKLILEHNLFGLDIDDRAGQLAGFALMMLAREDDRRIFGRETKLNVLSLQESSHLDFASLWQALNLTSEWQRGESQSLFDSEQSDLSAAQADNRYQLLKTTLARFTQAKTFGSLIEVPAEDAEPLAELLQQLRQLARDGDVMQKPAAEQLIPYVQQAWVLVQRYDAVVANPPYMGPKGMNAELKGFSATQYPAGKGDLFAAFMLRANKLTKKNGRLSQINQHSWMFLGSYEKLRNLVLCNQCFESIVHLGSRAFSEISGQVVQVVAFTTINMSSKNYMPLVIKADTLSPSEKPRAIRERINSYKLYTQQDFLNLPGARIAYWISKETKNTFSSTNYLRETLNPKAGMFTTNNELFLRLWWEPSISKVHRTAQKIDDTYQNEPTWFPYNKGGRPLKWYGNQEIIIRFENDGEQVCSYIDNDPKAKVKSNGRIINKKYYFQEGITWGDITAKNKHGEETFAARYTPLGFIFDIKGSSGFPAEELLYPVLCLLNSKVMRSYMSFINPSMTFQVGDISSIPYFISDQSKSTLRLLGKKAVEISKRNWDLAELSYDFNIKDFLQVSHDDKRIYSLIKAASRLVLEHFNELLTTETNINKILAKDYGLEEELDSELRPDEIILPVSQIDINILLIFSLSIGCIMGRYSLDREGLVYAHTGNKGFAELVAEGAYKTFPADSDGILPLTDQEWFSDDATNRFRKFVRTVWGEQHLQENLDFVAESLCLYAIKPLKGKSGGESALDTIRRYFSIQFYKDHLKTYKKRPIYWLFSSGKHKAFECLVYLHRYNDGTLARMRTEYVIPLTAKLSTYANKLEQDIDASTSTAEKKALEKQLATLHNQQAELATFDEKLRHHADQRISLDLDEGVKVNYSKFGDLLAEVKAVTGDKGD